MPPEQDAESDAILDADAQFDLGYMYHEGKGVSQDYSEAVKWLRKAAEQTDAEAQFGLGYMYFKGKGVPQDYSEAAKWFRKAAEQEYDLVQFRLGDMYFEGRGVPQNHEEAAKWFRKAAQQGLGLVQKRTEFKIVEDQSGTEFFLEATADIDTVMVRELDTGEEIFRGFLGEGMRLRLHRNGPVRITTSAGEFLRIEEDGERFQFPSKGRGATVFSR
ncbi:MAG: sel1 repeat family protein [Opitutales bacterium]|nr:sel1 repeat family protein [Opitutales bacterium]